MSTFMILLILVLIKSSIGQGIECKLDFSKLPKCPNTQGLVPKHFPPSLIGVQDLFEAPDIAKVVEGLKGSPTKLFLIGAEERVRFLAKNDPHKKIKFNTVI